ncbi:MAG: DUF4855 domain-containing protein [Armatimonadetes bacterium]|nr:DUF4855 domain-containing protein [Armatimonadota bacterium]
MLRLVPLTGVLTMVSAGVWAQGPVPGYLPPGGPGVGGIEDLVLIYHGSKARVPWTKDNILPYVAYLDERGQPRDWFFDGFLFIEFALDSGTWFHHYREGQPLPTIADWQQIAASWFRPGEGLDGLEAAVAEVAGKLGPPDKRVSVVITLPVPLRQDTAFGPLPGKTDTLDLSRVLDRQRALRWYIQEVLGHWRARGYRHLNLAGFYWTDETIGGDNSTLVRWTSDYLHARGLKHYWIPYYGAQGLREWRANGFDACMLQPNFFFTQERLPLTHFQTAAKLARMAGCGIEIEFDSRALSDEEYCQRMLAYLDAGVHFGWMKGALLGYYEGGRAIKDFHDTPGVGRELYRKVYEFVKGTYQPSGLFDFSNYSLVTRDNSANLALASRGAKVIGAEARPEWGTEIGPEQIIDGNIDFYGGMSGFGAFYIPGSVTIELPEVTPVARTQVMLFDLDGRYFQYRIETSVDGEEWEQAVDKSAGEWRGWQVDTFTPRPARYVRFTCLHNSANQICQLIELEVYAEP